MAWVPSDSCNDTWRSKVVRAIILTVFTSIASQPWVQCQEAGGLWFTKQTLASEAHLNCNYTLVMTFCNLWWEWRWNPGLCVRDKKKNKEKRRKQNANYVLKKCIWHLSALQKPDLINPHNSSISPTVEKRKFGGMSCLWLAHSMNKLETSRNKTGIDDEQRSFLTFSSGL